MASGQLREAGFVHRDVGADSDGASKVAQRPMVRNIGLASVAALGVAAFAWACADYRSWRALGVGGLPPNFRGWLQTTRWRLMKRHPFTLEAVKPRVHSDDVLNLLHDLPRRAGTRPRVAPHPVPHRQVTQLADLEVRRKLDGLFDRKVQDAAKVVVYARSHFEKRTQAITLRCPSCGHPDAVASHGEVAHVHSSDGSMHMILSPQDANALIEAGWAERHGLAGVTLGLPSTYMLVYAPRDDLELAVVDRIIVASIAHMAGHTGRRVCKSLL